MITDKNKLEYIDYRDEFPTYDIGLAAALVSFGYELWALEKGEPKTKFIFKREHGIEDSANKYFNCNLQVDARTIFDNLKMVKNRLYSL